MRLTKRTMNVAKLVNLQNALADCGIPSKIECVDDIICLSASLWNAVNGNEEPFTVYIEKDETINHCVDPQTDMQEAVKLLEELYNRL